MPLSPHFTLPAPCTFMTSRFSRYGQPLPGVRELFPDLFQRSMTTPHASPLHAFHDTQRHATYDMTNPSSPSHNFQPPTSGGFTAQSTAIDTDRPYTHPHPAPHPHTRPHAQRWSDDAGPSTFSSHLPQRSASPETSSSYRPFHPHQPERGGVGPSSLTDNEQTSSPMTSSPHPAPNSAESIPQPAPCEQKSVETHSGKKRHKCDVCGSYWGRPSSLKIHMVSHTGIKEFVCSICKQDFGVKSNYTRHIRVHHKDLSEGIQTRASSRRRRGSRRNQDVGPVRFVDEGPRFQGL